MPAADEQYSVTTVLMAPVLLACVVLGGGTKTQQPKTYPHLRIPATRQFLVILCFSRFSFTWGSPEVGGRNNFLDS